MRCLVIEDDADTSRYICKGLEESGYKLAVADGIVTPVQAEGLLADRRIRYEHALEAIAVQKWHNAAAPRKLLSLEALVEWLAGRLDVPYLHIDPLRIDFSAVTSVMSNAYAERYRILPIAIEGDTLTVATSEPFVRSWSEELSRMLRMQVKLVFANPQDIKRYLVEFYNLPRSVKKASQSQSGSDLAIARNFEQLVELGRSGAGVQGRHAAVAHFGRAQGSGRRDDRRGSAEGRTASIIESVLAA